MTCVVCIAALMSAAVFTQDAVKPSAQFIAVDVMIDAGTQQISAWQLELALPEHVTIVGIENASHPAFAAKPPAYDPAALANHRIILAQLADDTAAGGAEGVAEGFGRFRLTTLHLRAAGGFDPQRDVHIVEHITLDVRGDDVSTSLSFTLRDS